MSFISTTTAFLEGVKRRIYRVGKKDSKDHDADNLPFIAASGSTHIL